MIRILSQMLVGAFFAVLLGSATAQMYGGGHFQNVADTKAMPTQAGGDTTPPPAPADASSTAKSKASTSHSASKSSKHHAQVKSASHKKSTTHATKSTSHAANTHASKSPTKSTKAGAEPPVAPEESAYRQALRGCATQQDQARRDSCLDSAIEKYQRNT